MKASIMKSAARIGRNPGLPVLFALACSACVAYPAYDSGYAYGAGYGYGYDPAPVYSPAYVGGYWSSPAYVTPGPTVIVRDHDRYVYRDYRQTGHGWTARNGFNGRWGNGHDRGTVNHRNPAWHGNAGTWQRPAPAPSRTGSRSGGGWHRDQDRQGRH